MNNRRLEQLEDRIEELEHVVTEVVSDQQRLDLDAAAIADTFVNIKLEINRLENAAVAGQPLDFGKLEEALAAGKAIVAEAPPAPVPAPEPTPAPEPAPADNPSPEPAPAA